MLEVGFEPSQHLRHSTSSIVESFLFLISCLAGRTSIANEVSGAKFVEGHAADASLSGTKARAEIFCSAGWMKCENKEAGCVRKRKARMIC